MELVIENDNHEDLPAVVVDHLETCEQCRRQTDLLQGTIAALQATTAGTEDTALSQRIMIAVRKEPSSLNGEEKPQPVAFPGTGKSLPTVSNSTPDTTNTRLPPESPG